MMCHKFSSSSNLALFMFQLSEKHVKMLEEVDLGT